MTTLMFERVAIGLGGEGFGWRADRFATRCWPTRRRTRDPEVRHRFGEIAAEFLALRFTGYRMLTALQRGRSRARRARWPRSRRSAPRSPRAS